MLCPSGNGCVLSPEMKFQMNKNGRWIREGETWNEDGTITGRARRSGLPHSGWKGLPLVSKHGRAWS